jgi:lysophospholipase L1-like esterase
MRIHLLAAAFAALALAACASTPEASPPQTPAPGPARFDTAIAAFEASDRTAMPPRCATLFVGSSTIRFWDTLAADFPSRTVINRGFGGSTVWEVDAYFSRIVTPYHPKEIVFYAGDNDLAGLNSTPRTPDEVYADFVHFMDMKTAALGSTPVWFISVKPSLLRWSLQGQMTAINDKVRALAARRDDLAYIDIVPSMLGPDGQPKPIFREDRLHMTAEGYRLWTPIVTAALNQGQRAKAPGC